ncbi:unnamed protein product [Pieris brassicae]|uniref:Uncharacterized protein n=1 Tax=Pieris brassicae TaxID=7116 RepID=A0A9P0TIA3_PIEBR|nr:unnamed protein product [Pieris brassicae]
MVGRQVAVAARFADYAEAECGRRRPEEGGMRAHASPIGPAPHTRNLFISSYVKFTRNTIYVPASSLMFYT